MLLLAGPGLKSGGSVLWPLGSKVHARKWLLCACLEELRIIKAECWSVRVESVSLRKLKLYESEK